MDKKIIKSKATELRKEYWGTLLLSKILVAIVSSLPLIGFVASPPVKLGVYENYYNVYKGKDASWKKLYGKFEKQFESTVLYEILILIVTIIIAIALIIAGVLISMLIPLIGGLVAFAAILFAIPIIQGMENVGLEFLLLKPDMKGNEAFNEAIKYGKKYWKEYLLLALSYIGKFLLTLVTFGIYAVVFIPEISMAMVILTDEILTGEPVALSAKQDVQKKEPDAKPVTPVEQPVNNTAEPVTQVVEPVAPAVPVVEPTAPAAEPSANTNSVVNADTPVGTVSNQNKFCPHCGGKNESDAIFCEECGRML